ncbi:nrps5 single domain, non-ribosomal peptide synthase-like protein [Emydomyces testavorans]|uniref:Nrps5 single domain, non-ribosomal peptide synthase-like protein n=1 Tax=Emydomyces testavorans TaxID=2070801 RepID=A0AAF0DRX4_9EURO|nr:nrps5 single domain, non-ribosomal peptide synthase-like protein [Emydomyces testavorans]
MQDLNLVYPRSPQERFQDSVSCDSPSLNIELLISQIYSDSTHIAPVCIHPDGDDVAYLIYTSGSTGLPKGTLQHKGILNMISQAEGRLNSQPGQRNAQMLSLGFDCCVTEVLSTLCFGAMLVLNDPENPMAHLARVDATMATPSLLATLDLAEYSNRKVITLAGEAVSQGLNDKWATGEP